MMKLQTITSAINRLNATRGSKKTTEVAARERGAVETIQKHMEMMTVDINSAEFLIDIRRAVQTVFIPEGKRGNLAKYAGMTCYVIVMGIKRGSPRVMFYICEA